MIQIPFVYRSISALLEERWAKKSREGVFRQNAMMGWARLPSPQVTHLGAELIIQADVPTARCLTHVLHRTE